MTTRPPKKDAAQLPTTVVGIDVETTSLDPTTGDIIEIAAIRYRVNPTSQQLSEEIEELVLLAAPSQPLTDQITAITGITNEMVAGQPPFSQIVGKVQEFIGNDVLFAHNANFDVGYLTHNGLTINQPVWDTFALAGAAWPTAPSYNLGTLAQQLQIVVAGEHRAGDDVRLTWELLQKIYGQLQLTGENYTSVVRLLGESKQSHYIPLFQPKDQQKQKEEVALVNNEYKKRVASGVQPPDKTPSKNHYSPDKEVAAVLGPRGLLEQRLPGFRARREQEEMAGLVAKYLTEGGLGLIEAGTGTGKTYGYIVPLLLNLEQHPHGQAWVSTHTKSLQDQLMQRDVPQLLEALESKATVAALKGRRNYLCATRLGQALTQSHPRPADAWLLIKLLCWLEHDASGDLEQLNVSHQDSWLLRHLHADSLTCRQICALQQATCPYQRARHAAQAADLVIINHALLLQLGREEQASITHLVVDEAHHLVSAAREATSRDVSEHRIAEVVASLVSVAKGKGQVATHIRAEADQLLHEYQLMLKEISRFVEAHAAGRTLRLTATARRSAPWQQIMQQADTWHSKLTFTLGLVSAAATSKQQKMAQEAIREAEAAAEEMSQFIHGNPARIQWLEVSQQRDNQELQLHDVALDVTGDLARIYDRAQSVIMTSATLTVSGNFSYIKKQIGREAAGEHRLASPFNMRENMLIYIIEDSLDSAEQRYEQSIASIIEEAATLLSGRTLGLFTSHLMVKAVYFSLVKRLNKGQIKLLAQRLTGGRHAMITKFRQTPASVLLGTYSFWEGIDVPGDSLSAVIIPKLPFAPPHDPVIDAVAEAAGVSAFQYLTLPEMLLKLRQGIGRLLRTTDDRGVIILGDARILRQEYGAQVLNSLPPATVKIAPRSELAATLADWFGEEVIKHWQAPPEKTDQTPATDK